MGLLLLFLLLTSLSLVTAPVNLNQRYDKFRLQHMYSQSNPPDCGTFMNWMLPRVPQMDCKDCNTIILGDNRNSPSASLNDVLNVCRGGGSSAGGNLITSYKRFNVLICRTTTLTWSPPNCQYTAQRTQRAITIACDSGYPVHFQRC